MTRSLYIVGGAGAGKSTFMNHLLGEMDADFGPISDLHSKRNVKNLVTFRGHRFTSQDPRTFHGLYIGVRREEFPGTDGLDRASSPVGAEWLRAGHLPEVIVAEGATLSTRSFMTALHECTDLLLVHLFADDFVKELRFAERGSNQQDSFVTATATRAANLTRDMAKAGVKVWEADTASTDEWAQAIEVSLDHLRG